MPLVAELNRAAVDARALVSSARGATWTPGRVTVAAVWIVGLVGDAATTLLMMRTGLFEEANGFAATGMAALTPAGYTLVASLVCVVLAVAACAPRPVALYARVVWGCCIAIGVVKAYTAFSNALLWWSVAPPL